jgi:hypothetical protein
MLAINPDDPDANLLVGQYYCYVNDKWFHPARPF